MSLKLSLKPGEKVIIGGAVIVNGPSAASLHIENRVPVLRERDILTEEMATTPCKQVYLLLQLMYIGGIPNPDLAQIYGKLVADIIGAAPSTKNLISGITGYILEGKYYQALKKAQTLIQYEEELLNHVSEPS